MTLDEFCGASRGNAADLAKAIDVSPVLISQWSTGKRRVPAERCAQIEAATVGAVTCAELRPDIFQSLISSDHKKTA